MARRTIRGTAFALAAATSVGCCCRERVCLPACAPTAPVAATAATPALPPRIELGARRSETSVAPLGFAEAIAAIRAHRDAASRRAALVALRAKEPTAFLALGARSLATLAPDVMRAYDLSEALGEGGDADEPRIHPDDDMERDAPGSPAKRLSGLQRRAERLAHEVRTAAATGDGFVELHFSEHALRPTFLVVVGDDAAFARAEAALARVATVGGPRVHLTLDLLRPSDETGESPIDAAGPPSGERTLAAAPDEADLARRRIGRFELVAVLGRTVATWRTAKTAFVRDYETDAGSPWSEAVMGDIVDGFSASATLIARPTTYAVSLDAVWADLVRPLPTFVASLGGAAVTIELPELRIRRARTTLELSGARGLWAFGPGGWLLLRTETTGADRPTSPGWRRIDGSPRSGSPEPSPSLVTVGLRMTDDATGATLAMSEMSVLEGRSAALEMLDEWSFVSGYRLDTRGRADPTVARVGQGFDIEVTPVPSGSDRLDFDGRILSQRVDEPMRSATVSTSGTSQTNAVSLPVTHELHHAFRVSLAPGESARFPLRVGQRGRTPVAATMTLRYVRRDATAAASPK